MIIDAYSPNMSSTVLPEIPGSTIALIAIIPAKITNTARPKVTLSMSLTIPELPFTTGLKYVMTNTITIPSKVNIASMYFCLRVSNSSIMMIGIAASIRPMKSELI